LGISFGQAMSYCHIRGKYLYYDLVGQGSPLVLLHHATASSRTWRRQLQALAAHFQVLLYDRPGFGQSEWLAEWGPDYLSDDVEDLIALLDHLGIEQTALAGHSDGAAIALLAAARHGARVRCCVAEAPHVFVETTTCPPAVAAYRDQVLASAELQAALARDHGERGMAVLQRWAEWWTDPRLASWNVSDELAAIECPVLIIHGAADPFFPQSHAELIRNYLADGSLWVETGVGHVPHAEVTGEFNRRVVDFLRERGAR
jgi:pimeloyl-ACP methyl ester carboxylesterase